MEIKGLGDVHYKLNSCFVLQLYSLFQQRVFSTHGSTQSKNQEEKEACEHKE